MKKFTDAKQFKNVLPYASEIFGVYQPLLGWKSKRTVKRIVKGFQRDRSAVLRELFDKYKGIYKLTLDRDLHVDEIHDVGVGHLMNTPGQFDLTILGVIAEKLPHAKSMHDSMWSALINKDQLTRHLNTTVLSDIKKTYLKGDPRIGAATGEAALFTAQRSPSLATMVEPRINRESVMAGILLELVESRQYAELRKIFYTSDHDITHLTHPAAFQDPFDAIDPKKDLDRVGLSPIGIVHLFRQYFFEFDTFLGSPVGHIWLSSGSTVELIEISTRRTITEKTTEMQTETTTKLDTSTTDQDELSEAVKDDNKSDTKFGANVSASQSWVWGSANESASFDLANTQQTAREQTHKHMREQTEKLSTEIRKNYKSSFKTITDVTDTTSKRYVLTNNTHELVNYELRRKMRQIGVQVQDIGTYLCWQTYVDEPGSSLGVAELVHIAKPPELDSIPHPEAIVAQKSIIETVNIQIPFVGRDTSDNDIAYTNGSETEVGAVDSEEHIECNFPQQVTCKEVNYYLDSVSLQPQGADVHPSVRSFTRNTSSNSGSFTVHLDYVDFHGQDVINISAVLSWKPNQDPEAIKKANDDNLKMFTARLESEYRNSYVAAVRERIKLASSIQPRSYEDLREEERIVVYRKLIQELLAPEKVIPQPDYRTRHIVSELISSIFDVDKMLYFVAPEWWKPRTHAHQSFGTLKSTGKIGKDGQPEMVPDLTNTTASGRHRRERGCSTA